MSGQITGTPGSDGQPTVLPTFPITEIPYGWQVPGTYIQVGADYGNAGLLDFPARAVIFAQKLATNSAQPSGPATFFDAADVAGVYGFGSSCHRMASTFFAANPDASVDIVGLADPVAAGGPSVPASFNLAVTGTVLQGGTIPLYIGGQYVPVLVETGDTAATVISEIVAAIGSWQGIKPLAVTANVGFGPGAGAVSIFHRHGGAIGNGLNIRIGLRLSDSAPPGLTFTTGQLAGGVGVPDLTAALNSIAGLWYTDIAVAWSDTNLLSELGAELMRRYTAMGKLDGRAYLAYQGSQGQIQPWLAGLNQKLFAAIVGQNLQSPTDEWSASLMGLAMARLSADPARQLRGTVMPGIVGPVAADAFDADVQNAILHEGGSTFDVLRDGTVVLSRVVTTDTTNTLGAPDPAWHDIMEVAIATRIRWDWSTYVTLVYPNNKMANDGDLAAEYDPSVVTPRRMHGAWAARCQLYGRQGWIVDVQNQVANASFAIDPNNKNQMLTRQPIKTIGNLMILQGILASQV